MIKLIPEPENEKVEIGRTVRLPTNALHLAVLFTSKEVLLFEKSSVDGKVAIVLAAVVLMASSLEEPLVPGEMPQVTSFGRFVGTARSTFLTGCEELNRLPARSFASKKLTRFRIIVIYDMVAFREGLLAFADLEAPGEEQTYASALMSLELVGQQTILCQCDDRTDVINQYNQSRPALAVEGDVGTSSRWTDSLSSLSSGLRTKALRELPSSRRASVWLMIRVDPTGKESPEGLASDRRGAFDGGSWRLLDLYRKGASGTGRQM